MKLALEPLEIQKKILQQIDVDPPVIRAQSFAAG
jgi:hypothetical protein